MKISELWLSGDLDWRGKTVEQWVSAAGSGKLTDGSETSAEFRQLLAVVDFDQLIAFAEQCLSSKAPFSGHALQDAVNAIGQRLGFDAEFGRYKGTSKEIGFDGLWTAPTDNHRLVVEIKTSDVYRIALDRTAQYRARLIAERHLDPDVTSILYVVGRENTGDLEAQIRGSRYAWTTRMVSIDALCRLLNVSAKLDDPADRERIFKVLRPYEYTRVDSIIDLVFRATDYVTASIPDSSDDSEEGAPAPARFHLQCLQKIEKRLGKPFVEISTSQYSSSDASVNGVIMVSKTYHKNLIYYWYAFYPYNIEFLGKASQGFVAFGCGDAEKIILIPRDDFISFLPHLHTTTRGDRYYYHVRIIDRDRRLFIAARRGSEPIDVTRFRM